MSGRDEETLAIARLGARVSEAARDARDVDHLEPEAVWQVIVFTATALVALEAGRPLRADELDIVAETCRKLAAESSRATFRERGRS